MFPKRLSGVRFSIVTTMTCAILLVEICCVPGVGVAVGVAVGATVGLAVAAIGATPPPDEPLQAGPTSTTAAAQKAETSRFTEASERRGKYFSLSVSQPKAG
jgi:hypothetical protein